MSQLRTYDNLQALVTQLREDLNQQPSTTKKKELKSPPTILLIYAYNRTGKTRLSMEFKNSGKREQRKLPHFSAE